MPEGVLLRITKLGPRGFCAGIIVGQRHAPILWRLAGMSEEEIRAYCRRRGWKVELVP